MVRITDRAAAYIKARDFYDPGSPHCILVHKDSGSADNRRSPDGENEWIIRAATGWRTTVCPLNHVLGDVGDRLRLVESGSFGVKVIVDATFPGGEVDVSDNRLVLHVDAL